MRGNGNRRLSNFQIGLVYAAFATQLTPTDLLVQSKRFLKLQFLKEQNI
jgi:hypothetical protein